MLKRTKSATEIRRDFRGALTSGKLQRFPGAFSPFLAPLIEEIGFDGVYISGAGIANDLGYPDIGLTTQADVAARGRATVRHTNLPTLIDIDTGFGETLNVARTVEEMEDLGLSAVHLEDQINPKRCGHLDGKGIVERSAMAQKVRAAADAKRDPNFLIMARTDAKTLEGIESAIDRAKAYVDAGAEAIFPEALYTQKEFEQFRKAVSVPLLANMTEFGKSELLTVEQLQNLGYNLVIYPMTGFRLAMKAVEDGLRQIYQDGHQKNLIDKMQTRSRLYEILEYEKYNELDQSIFNFKLNKNQ